MSGMAVPSGSHLNHPPSEGELIMSDDSDELPIASDNLLVASEVMSSAIRILSLLDLDDRQIADLFIAESSEGTGLDLAIPALDDDDDEDATDASPWSLGRLAENESFSKEIERFAKRVSALRTEQEPGPGEVQKLTDLCLSVIPAFAGAQRWYREQCAQQGLEFALYRDVWRASASDEMLDHEHEVVFFDQTSISHELQTLESVADHCERLALAEPIEQILSAIEQEGLQLPPRSLRSLQTALGIAAQYVLVLEMLDRLVPGSETPRSELVNAILRDLPIKVESWLIETWLALAADAGVIDLYKKSNRWQVHRAPADQ
jgi:hypothetical protein